jgi:hypothetical protein
LQGRIDVQTAGETIRRREHFHDSAIKEGGGEKSVKGAKSEKGEKGEEKKISNLRAQISDLRAQISEYKRNTGFLPLLSQG